MKSVTKTALFSRGKIGRRGLHLHLMIQVIKMHTKYSYSDLQWLSINPGQNFHYSKNGEDNQTNTGRINWISLVCNPTILLVVISLFFKYEQSFLKGGCEICYEKNHVIPSKERQKSDKY